MNTQINTVARFLISAFYIANGFLLMNSFYPKDFIPGSSISLLFFLVGSVELSSGLFLFLGYKKSAFAVLLIICTLITGLFVHHGFFELLNSSALAGSLILIINNDSGITFLEYVQTDINDLPDYKVKM